MNIWVDGFEGYGDTNQVYGSGADDSGIGGGGRGGGALLGMGIFDGNRPINVTQASGPLREIIVGYARKSPNGTQPSLWLNSAGGVRWLTTGVDNVNRAYAGSAAGNIITPTLIPFRCDSVWRYYEHKFILNISGTNLTTIDYELRIDEHVITTVTGITGPTTTDREINFVGLEGGGSFDGSAFDDLYINTLTGPIAADNTYWGDTRIHILKPNGAVASAFAPTPAVPNYQNVDEASTDNDTTYNSSGTVGDKDTFEYEDTGLPAGTVIRTVAVMTTARRQADSGPRELTSYLKHGAVEVSGGVHQLSDTYYTVQMRVPQCPSTSAPWTPAQVDAARGSYALTA